MKAASNHNLKPGEADVCLVLEGSYPYVSGGVSSWTHDLILSQPHLKFHLLVLLAPGAERQAKYSLPKNVIDVTEVTLSCVGGSSHKRSKSAFKIEDIESAIRNLMHDGNLNDFQALVATLADHQHKVSTDYLMDSPDAWEMMLRMYHEDFSRSSFIDFFWTWRGLLNGLFSVLLSKLPKAKVYHAVSTGYAGLYLVRAKLEANRPTLLTEHGIYTNERRIEIAMANWLHEGADPQNLSIERTRRDLRDLWMHSFQSYSRACYQACDRIITLFEGNQSFQLQDGADLEKMEIIPNGIEYEKFEELRPIVNDESMNIALIGRVVPIKDVKTYIRAIAMVRASLPEVKGYLLGPYDEDPSYFEECKQLVDHLDLGSSFEFTGKVNLSEWMDRIDLLVLTSISEGQPLVILEAGAAGIPCITTDVGACRELIEGDSRENPSLGKGGEVVPLANPGLTARAITQLLTNRQLLSECGETIKERVRIYYNKADLKEKYQNLYNHFSRESDSLTESVGIN